MRLTEQARDALQEARAWQAQHSGPAQAALWYDEMLAAASTLATLPLRCPVAAENDAFQQFQPGPALRALLFRHRRPEWRILFTVHEADADDPPTVRVHHIRHSAQAPLTLWPPDDPNAA